MEDSGEDENNEQKTSKEVTEPVSIMLLKITFRLHLANFCSTFSGALFSAIVAAESITELYDVM